MTITSTWVTSAIRRDVPRLARLADQGRRNANGAAAALILALWLWGRPVLIAAVASPRWSHLAARVADEFRTRRATLAGLADLLLAWLVGLDWWFGLVLGVLGLTWAGTRTALAVYPLTRRGRVRTRYGVDGFATVWDWWRHLSPHAAREAAVALRPSLAATLPVVDETAGVGVAAGQRAARAVLTERVPIEEAGTWVGRTAVGPVLGLNCYVPHRDTVGVVAAPQTLKTAWMTGRVIDHPGAVVATSTKGDTLALTGALRARRSRPGRIEVFDPEHITDGGSTFRWSPVARCERPAVASERAAAFVAASSSAGGEDSRFWEDTAARVLRCLLLAAALDGRGMADVAAWANSAVKADDALDLLEGKHARASPAGWAPEMRQLIHTEAKRTRESIFLTLSGAVAFMGDPRVAELCCPGPGEPVFDVAAFLADRGTLYLIGSEREHSTVAPLLAVLTSHIFEEAKRIAGQGRLDPSLMLALDEAALIVPVPLHRWIADAGGRGIHILWACQSLSQLAERWGDRAAETIFNATNAKLIPGGLSLISDVETISKLAGERLELVPDPDDNGRARFDRVPILTPEKVRTVPPWHAVLLHRSTPATIVSITPAWERADVKKAGPPPAVPPIRVVVAEQGLPLVGAR